MGQTNIIDLGKVGITVEKTPWSASSFYERLTMVHHVASGNTYVSVEDNINRDPSKDDGSNWILASSNGMSIYELMVARGKYSGTEEQFLADYAKSVSDANAAAERASTAADRAYEGSDMAREQTLQCASATELCETATANANAATTAATTAAADAASIKTALDNFIAQGGGATDAQVVKNTGDISQLAQKVNGINDFEQGSFASQTDSTYHVGEIMPTVSTRISSRFNIVEVNKPIKFYISSGYFASILCWDGTSDPMNEDNKSGWVTGEYTFSPKYRNLFITLAKGSNRDQSISPSESSNINLDLSLVSSVSLLKNNVNAINKELILFKTNINGIEINDFEQGTFADNTDGGRCKVGDLLSNDTRIVSRFNVVPSVPIHFSIEKGYYVSFNYWDGSSDAIQTVDKSGWLDSSGLVIPTHEILFIVIAKGNEKTENIIPSESSAFKFDVTDSVKDIRNAVKELENEIFKGILKHFEQGSFADNSAGGRYNVGDLMPEFTNRIVSRFNIVEVNKPISYKVTDGYFAAFVSWDGVSDPVNSDSKSGWVTGDGVYIPKYETLFVTIAKGSTREDNITPSESSCLTIAGSKDTDDNTWKNKKIVTFGDSITEMNTWQPFLINKLGCSIVNLGIGGTRVASKSFDGSSYTNTFTDDARIESIPLDADAVIVMGGTNDFGTPCAIVGNEIVENSGTYNTDTFTSALAECLRKIQNRVPNALVIVMPLMAGQYTSKNYVAHQFVINKKPTQNKNITIRINSNTYSLSLSEEDTINSVYVKLYSLNIDNNEYLKGWYYGNDRLLFVRRVDTPEITDCEITGDDENILSYKRISSIPQRVNQLGYTGADYRNSAEYVSKCFNLPFIDVWRCGLNYVNRSGYFSDTVHPNNDGGKRMAQYIIGELKKIQPL